MSAANPEELGRALDYRQEAGAFLTIMDEMAPQVALDYSVESLQRLDQFISEHFEPPGGKVVGDSLAVGIGCYLGEVIIRHLGGHWNKDGEPAVEGIGPLETVFPLEKVKSRFRNGKQDSLAWYYHALVKKAGEAGFEAHAPARPPSSSPVTAPSKTGEGFLGLFRHLFP
jgi:hypothetical protein